tara:strand:+ start:635 stop:928 length:294 start_codon:yes stop_codon:yes gene_type:complete
LRTKKVIILRGPTASGKTDLSLELAEKFPIDLISVDSVMVYKGLNIGSAKPSKQTLKRYPHHLMTFVSQMKNIQRVVLLLMSRKSLETFNQMIVFLY